MKSQGPGTVDELIHGEVQTQNIATHWDRGRGRTR